MKIHQVQCNECKKKAPLKYNEEHWLIPENWVALWCDHEAVVLDIHLCDSCRPFVKDKYDAKKKEGPR